MKKYFVIAVNGFQSSNYYSTREEAQAAADRRNAISGQPWAVREVWLADEYADDNRPHRAR